MKRRLSTFCSAGSLLLSVAVCALWVRSYWVGDYLQVWLPWVPAGGQPQKLELFGDTGEGVGKVVFQTWTDSDWAALKAVSNGPWAWRIAHQTVTPTRGDAPLGRGTASFWDRRGFATYGGRSYRIIYFPLWLPASLVALPLLFVLIIVRHRRRVRRSSGLCSGCGYDLRATPDRCPKCGTSVQSRA